MNAIIEVKRLSFGYDLGKYVLKDVDLSLERGSMTAVLGRNGCGKSTLLDCLIGYNRYVSGSVTVDGISVKDSAPRELAKKISYIPQDTSFVMNYRARDFIMFGRTCHIGPGQNPADEDYDIVEEAAKKCDITRLMDKEIDKLSGGERQLVFIARAIVQESPAIVMDEPMSYLDFGNQALVSKMMMDLSKEGKTVLFTTHNPNHVLDMDCDVLVMKDGTVWKHGRAPDVLTYDTVRTIYGKNIVISDGTDKRFSFLLK